jgi:hypothetical protein
MTTPIVLGISDMTVVSRHLGARMTGHDDDIRRVTGPLLQLSQSHVPQTSRVGKVGSKTRDDDGREIGDSTLCSQI